MFLTDEISSTWKQEEEKEKKSPLEKRTKKNKSTTTLYNGKNRKYRFKLK